MFFPPRLTQPVSLVNPILSGILLDSPSILQQLRQLGLFALQLRIAANMLVVDEDIRHGALARNLLKRILNRGAVVDLVKLDLRNKVRDQYKSRRATPARGRGVGGSPDLRCMASRHDRSTTSW